MKTKKSLLIFFSGFNINIFLSDRNISEWYIVSFSEIISLPIKSIFTVIRKEKYYECVFGVRSILEWRYSYPILFFGLFSTAKKKYFYDNNGNTKSLSFLYYINKFLIFSLHIIFSLLVIFSTYLVTYILLVVKLQFAKSIASKQQNEKKILAFLRTDNFGNMITGGSFTHFEGVYSGMLKCGYSMRVYAQGKPGNFNDKNTIFIKVPIIPFFDFFEIGEIFYTYQFTLSVMKDLRKHKVDFLYHRHSIFNFSGALLKCFLRIPLILEYNGSEPWAREKWSGKLFLKSIAYMIEKTELHAADKIIVVSDVLKDELESRGFDSNKIIVNPNGVDSDNFLIEDNEIKNLKNELHISDKIVIGFLGSFGPWHGVEILARAVKFSVEKNKNLHFIFIGDGSLRLQVEKIIKENNSEGFVTFLGTIPHSEVPQYLSICDILVSPHVPNLDGSRFFGSPTKLFEYMAVGKAIIASKLEQIGEILEHKKTAFLVKPGDIQELSDSIVYLAHDKKLCVELGGAARNEVIKNYTWKMNAQRVISAYHTLLNSEK